MSKPAGRLTLEVRLLDECRTSAVDSHRTYASHAVSDLCISTSENVCKGEVPETCALGGCVVYVSASPSKNRLKTTRRSRTSRKGPTGLPGLPPLGPFAEGLGMDMVERSTPL